MKNSKSFNFPTASILMLTLVLAMSGNARAQVTIGENLEPQSFSVLELISNNTKGLRLPQMDSVQRNEMMGTEAFKNEIKGKACGLQIFNTSTLCVETWNGTKWIEQCMPCEGITFPALDGYYNFCNGATVADLEEKIGADIYEYPSGGSKRASATVLETGIIYYAEQRVANCAASTRTAVTVNIGSCSVAPMGAVLSAWTNVMYDFQHQTIEAYNNISGGGIGIDYEWSVSTNGSANSFTPIDDAPNSPFFTVPANFSDRYNSGDYLCDTLWFKCKISNNSGVSATTADDFLDIIFIKTTSAGYGELNGVKYITLGKGSGGKTVNETDGSTATMKVALLNLGQSADWKGGKDYELNNNAGDLGDFYQWGRVADGHQNIVWKKPTTGLHRSLRQFTNSFGDTPANTSDTIDYINPAPPAYNVYDHQVANADPHYGKFIDNGPISIPNSPCGDYDWYNVGNTTSGHDNDLWGNSDSSHEDRLSDISLSSWTYPSNNPCPAGWRVPSKWNFWDLFQGNGIDTGPVVMDNDNFYYNEATNNTWQWRANNAYNGYNDKVFGYDGFDYDSAHGGIIITNSAGEKIYLPTTGNRSNGIVRQMDFFMYSTSTYSSYYGYYNAHSLYANTCNYSNYPIFNPNLKISFSYQNRGTGMCVRCVADF
ncbi:MAG: hypothetical protein LBS50_05030 [Prevotellaceae bacterium]|jgi:hypothetical protein|nr:hypothetical protein [Prevotellaceae bacterium]